jgi:hypothetical protein
MGDLLENAAAWLGDMRARFLSRPVTYSRAAASVPVAAAVGRTEFAVDDGYGVVERWESRDFLIAARDLVLGGTVVLPAAGDRVSETQDGKVFVYEVMAPGKEPCWRYSDPYRRTLRIHTKQVAME